MPEDNIEEFNVKDNISNKTDTLPVLTLRNTVLFPQQVIPIYIGREQSLNLINDLPEEDKRIMVIAQREGAVEDPKPDDLYDHGTVAQVLKIFKMPDESKSAIVQGLTRAQVSNLRIDKSYYIGEVEELDEYSEDSIEIDAMVGNLKKHYKNLIEIAPYLSEEHKSMLTNIQDPARLVDRGIHLMKIPTKEKQDIIEELNVKNRIEKAIVIINREIQRIELGEKIQSDVQDEISKNQREYFLREKLKQIKKELGEEEGNVEIKELKEKVEEANLTKEAREVAEKEIKRLERIPAASPEYNVTRTYVEWLTDLPWETYTEDNLDIKKAQEILDEDHYGLEDIKERILEYLSVRKLKRESENEEASKGPILCFVGPPGVGKTSIGRSIARAMGREFIRISLGGVRDEAEIRGHRRTYIGALPGRIIQNIKKCGSSNPVFMLDEIDKVGSDFRGDPSSALLEVLDPEQNSEFSDHYLEVDYDLSKVMFIATGNLKDPILPALKDRMEMIEFSGYTEDEKVKIARSHLLPKQIKENALNQLNVEFKDEALQEIIRHYTKESGVRNLEREIGNVCRKIAHKHEKDKRRKNFEIDKESISEFLGPKKFLMDVAERLSKPGVAIGLAWTQVGGDILFVEATKMKGSGKLKLTGKLGDVMKESCEAAVSYIRSNAKELNIDEDMFENTDLHIHVPAGAVPKDGPSAGVTILSAVYSLLTNTTVKDNYAMTGEITFRGSILPVGGIKEKVLAAKRAGLNHVILPDKNKKDMADIPDRVKKDMEFHFAGEMCDVLEMVIEKDGQKCED
ncbi:MAG: endopeptidase La [Candidatus Marinimicrobia bacterium]|nr:endopeptidase La [Candidatus Neomarinimicrobiota bacterium]